MSRRARVVGLVCLALALALRIGAARVPELVERWYAGAVYPPLAAALGAATAFTAASVAELVLAGAIVVLLAWTARGALRALRPEETWSGTLGAGLLNALALAGPIYLAFLAVWGLNYQRLPFALVVGYPAPDTRTPELAALCAELVEDAKRMRAALAEDADGVLRIPGGVDAVLARASLGFEPIAGVHPAFALRGYPAKRPRAPAVLSILRIAGVYFPFTGEAHVNVAMPAPELPFTACHELAHRRGIAREDEASFASWLACRAHPDAQFRYSGALNAATHALYALADVDKQRALDLLVALRAEPGVARDLDAVSEFWSGWKGPVGVMSHAVNDAYLVSQGEEEGVESYGRMVDLLLAERQARAAK